MKLLTTLVAVVAVALNQANLVIMFDSVHYHPISSINERRHLTGASLVTSLPELTTKGVYYL